MKDICKKCILKEHCPMDTSKFTSIDCCAWYTTLKKILTCDLVEELKTRESVEFVSLHPDNHFYLEICGDMMKSGGSFTDQLETGPCIILKVID
jgi:hypothetical protein